jgi:hypothetical protein
MIFHGAMTIRIPLPFHSQRRSAAVHRILLLVSILASCRRDRPDVTESRWQHEDQAHCDALITPALRDRYLRGLERSVGPRSVADTVVCRFAHPGDDPGTLMLSSRGASVMIECSPTATSRDRIAIATTNYARSETPIAGVGRAAIASRFRLMFWASKADCNATIDWDLDPDDLVPFARALDGVLGATP